MKTPYITTSVYKYRRQAPWMIAAYVLFTIVFFLSSPILPSPAVVLAMMLVIGVPIYAAVKPKSIFSIRSVDERRLTLNPDQIIWGTWLIPIEEVNDLNIYIHAFDNFRRGDGGRRLKRLSVITEYGDRNKLEFKYRDGSYDLTFFLGTYKDYQTLIQIIEEWKAAGVNLSAKSTFTDEYIREQMRLWY